MNNDKELCECKDPTCKEHRYADCTCCIDAEFKNSTDSTLYDAVMKEEKPTRRNK